MKSPARVPCSKNGPVRPASGTLPAGIHEDGESIGRWAVGIREKTGGENEGSVWWENCVSWKAICDGISKSLIGAPRR